MSKIGISLNEVMRNFLSQLLYTYEKYKGEVNINEDEIKSLDLINYLDFKDVNELNRFIYLEAPLEIMGHADQMSENLMSIFNNFLVDIEDFTDHKIEIVSREVDKSIPSTLFFLSKLSCRVKQIRFVTNFEEKWDGLDVLITANPEALKSKPEGKISVKVKAPYNTDTKADYEIDSLVEFIKDEQLRNKILNTKITSYEEL